MADFDNDDNLYPSAGFQPFAEPTEQKVERAREEGMARAAEPVIEQILAHFKKRIAFYDSVDSVPQKDRKDPVVFMHTVDSNAITKANLENERQWLEGLLEQQ